MQAGARAATAAAAARNKKKAPKFRTYPPKAKQDVFWGLRRADSGIAHCPGNPTTLQSSRKIWSCEVAPKLLQL